ncbi:hypothetical protein FS749_010825 [Ceratobasidium sp. UAMH 11750]|nr:hypothetical protein FS749_010825 [Ceratobasidium sp. UAMH 11750]
MPEHELIPSSSSPCPRASRVCSGNTPASTVSTHIRTHLARGTPQLLLRHSLQPRPRHPAETPSIEDRAVGPSPDGSTERKKGTSWYLSEAAGFASPWDRLGIPTPKEPESDAADVPIPPSPAVAHTPTPPPMDPTRVSSRKRTRTKSWSAAARELGMDGMSPPPDYEDESEAEAHRERKSKVRIRLRLGSRSSSARPDDPQPQPEPQQTDESDPEPASCAPVVIRRHSRPNLPPPLRSRVFSAPSSQFTHFRRSLSYASSAGPPTPHAPTFVDADGSDVEDGDFHVRMMCNSDSAPPSPSKSTSDAPLVGIGVGLVFGEEGRRVKVKEEHEASMSPPSLSSRASSLAASSLPEDDIWAVKIEEPEDVTMTEIALEPEPCNTGLGFELGSSLEGFEAEFTLLSMHSPTIVPTSFLWGPGDADGPESLCADEVDGLWTDLNDKRPHTRASRRESGLGKPSPPRAGSTKRRDSASWGCRAPSGMRVSLCAAKSRAGTECPTQGVVVRRDRGLQIERTVLHGVEYGSCIVRGCVLLRRLEGSYVSLTALLRACRVPGSCHAQFRTAGTVDVAAPAPEAPKADSIDNAPPISTTPPTTQPLASATSTAPEPASSDVLHTGTSSSEIHPSNMPLGASIDFGTGVEAADISGMWCPLADARAIAEERLKLYLPEDIRQIFLADVLPLKEPTPEVEEPKLELGPEPEAETQSKTEKRDDTPMATAIPEKMLAASEDDVPVHVRPSSPATVPCAAQRRVLRTRPARVVRTRTRA